MDILSTNVGHIVLSELPNVKVLKAMVIQHFTHTHAWTIVKT